VAVFAVQPQTTLQLGILGSQLRHLCLEAGNFGF